MQPTLDVSGDSQSRKRPPSPHQSPGQLSPAGRPQNTHLIWLYFALIPLTEVLKQNPVRVFCPTRRQTLRLRLPRTGFGPPSRSNCSQIVFNCFPLASSCAAAGIPGGQEEAVHESSSAGQAEERHRAGQGSVPHRQKFGPHHRRSTRRRRRGHQQRERARTFVLYSWELKGQTSEKKRPI